MNPAELRDLASYVARTNRLNDWDRYELALELLNDCPAPNELERLTRALRGNYFLTATTDKGEAIKVGDTVRLTDDTVVRVVGMTGKLIEHSGGFTERVKEIVHRA